MSAQTSKKMDILKILRNQNAVRLNRDLQRFRKAAQALSSDYPRLINKYPDQWVAVYHGKVAAHASTLPAILGKMKRKRIPQAHTIVRYIEKNKRTMILRELCSAGDSAIQPGDRISRR
jgi:hypothetical protein